MKQIILNITKNEQGYNLIINATKEDDNSVIRKVINHNQLNEKDTKFISDLETLIVENYGD